MDEIQERRRCDLDIKRPGRPFPARLVPDALDADTGAAEMKDSNLIFLKLRRSERDPDPFRTPGYVVAILTALSAVGLMLLGYLWIGP